MLRALFSCCQHGRQTAAELTVSLTGLCWSVPVSQSLHGCTATASASSAKGLCSSREQRSHQQGHIHSLAALSRSAAQKGQQRHTYGINHLARLHC